MGDVEQSMHRLTRGRGEVDLATAAAAVTAVTAAAGSVSAGTVSAGTVPAGDLLDALVVTRWMKAELDLLEPALIAAARHAGASWQDLAPALGVASRQAAERRYLRLTPGTTGDPATREGRVRAERDRRAGTRAVDEWANANTADLRRLAGQISALTDLDPAAAAAADRLHDALADPDATALPALLVAIRVHLHGHARLAAEVDAVDLNAQRVRRDSTDRRAGTSITPRTAPETDLT